MWGGQKFFMDNYLNRLILIFILVVTSGCAQWLPANYGEIAPGVFKISATGNSFASREDLQQKIDKKAEQLCLPHGYSYTKPANIESHKQEVTIDGVEQSSYYFVVSRVAYCNQEN